MSRVASDNVTLYDAHNHLQDERLAPHVASVVQAAEAEGIRCMVVNGSCEEDWEDVLALSRRYSFVLPSFGYHPWYVKECSPTWFQRLREYLDLVPSAIGEIGLDKWIKDHDLPHQKEVFRSQFHLAAERNLPVSIHCLQAWGTLYDMLREGPRPRCGFVLHSFGGPAEMVDNLASLGAYFSLPGYFAHDRKTRQRETFKRVPLDRLLIETDAPDQLLPEERAAYKLHCSSGKPLNHPANLKCVYEFACELLEESIETLAARVECNFLRLFGGLSNAARSTGRPKPA